MAAPELSDLVTELVADGAEVVWLAGSRARGDPGPYSDIDLGVLVPEGRQRPRAFRIFRNSLTSIVWTTPQATRASFNDPAQLGGSVPGWRRAVLLHDPKAIGAELQRDATHWAWEGIAERCDRWVSAQMAQLAEEVHKLLNALTLSDETNAAVQRNVLTHRLPLVLSVHLRILYDSERRLRDLVASEVGGSWRSEQRTALSLDGTSLRESTGAALTLFVVTCGRLAGVLTDDTRAVVDHTVRLIKARGMEPRLQ